MLRKLTRTVLVLAALATGALGVGAATATPAAAGNFSIGVQVGPSGVQLAQYRHRDRRHARPRNVCNPQQALNKASRLGINRARLVRANRNAVVIDGRSRGRPVTARFAQARGCPLIAYR